jgi:DNA polymerase III epsilon subunit-like protein
VIALDQPVRGSTIAVIDTETTGLESSARIVEVAVVRIERFGEADARGELVYETLVDPEQEIPWGAVQVHGIRDRDVRGKPTWDRVWPVVLEHLADAVPAAHNHSFDLRILSSEALNLGLPAPPDKGSWIDTYTLLRRLGEQPATLEAACEKRKIPAGRHRAASDAMATARLLWPLLREVYGRKELGAPERPTVARLLWWLHATKKERLRAAPPPPQQAALPVARSPKAEPPPVQVVPLPRPEVVLVAGSGPLAAPLPTRIDRSLVVSISSLPAPEQQIVRITSEVMTGLPWGREGRYGQRTTVQLGDGTFRRGFLCPSTFEPPPAPCSCVVWDGLEVVLDYVDGAGNVVLDERGKAQLRRSDKGDGGWNLHSHVPDARVRIRTPQQAEADRALADALRQAELERQEAERAEHDRKRAWAQRRAQGGRR